MVINIKILLNLLFKIQNNIHTLATFTTTFKCYIKIKCFKTCFFHDFLLFTIKWAVLQLKSYSKEGQVQLHLQNQNLVKYFHWDTNNYLYNMLLQGLFHMHNCGILPTLNTHWSLHSTSLTETNIKCVNLCNSER